MKKIMLFEGDIETQGYFSLQLAEAFQKMGHETFVFDLSRPWNSTERFFRFFEQGNTVLVNFNFHGMSGEEIFLDENDRTMWDALQIPSYNIVVDHPMYYHHFFGRLPRGYHHINIDRNHQKYMQRFFPQIPSETFLPLAGTEFNPNKSYVPVEYRRYDVTMVGNYTPPSQFEKYITRIDDEYTAFYYGMIDDLLAHPMRTVEEVAEEHIRREIPEVTEEEIKGVMSKLTFIDLYVRFKTRGEAVKALADAGIKVHTFGGGWDRLSCKRPENLISGSSLDSVGCLKKLSQSKISLNVMPWFRDGAHDRVFNTMLNGSLCLTDSSVYLDEILEDKVNCKIYSLTQMEDLPEMVYGLLANPPKLQEIIDNGYKMAKEAHTWEHRAAILHDMIEKEQG
ncbi:MAG: glycosyltransferase family 1 protein [Lachnospiraceae bacterium]|nr:glycosyltransferase family 1 protein [Lachnospiraceae bacterium]